MLIVERSETSDVISSPQKLLKAITIGNMILNLLVGQSIQFLKNETFEHKDLVNKENDLPSKRACEYVLEEDDNLPMKSEG